MTETPEYGIRTGTQPEYGVTTCGQTLEPPFDVLGPCRLEPGHEGKHMVKAPGMADGVLMNVSEVEPITHPWYSDEYILKQRKIARRLTRWAFVSVAVNMTLSAWLLLRAFHLVP